MTREELKLLAREKALLEDRIRELIMENVALDEKIKKGIDELAINEVQHESKYRKTLKWISKYL